METNRNESSNESSNLSAALRRESVGISGSQVMSESRGEDIGDEPEPDVRDGGYELEDISDVIDNTVRGNSVREVNIKPLDSGYLVKVGCQSVAVETTETLIKALGDYLNNPESFERAWFKNKNRNKL
jgi:hypothetical protein